MASTNKTANLSLNQWVPTDPVLMEDMNEDNRKLDAALGATVAANRFDKLFDFTTTVSTPCVELNLSGIDLSKYQILRLCCFCSFDDNSYLRINKISTAFYRVFSMGNWETTDPCRIFGSWIDIDISAASIIMSNHFKTYYLINSQLKPAQLKTIDIVATGGNGDVQSGKHYVLWGVKK